MTTTTKATTLLLEGQTTPHPTLYISNLNWSIKKTLLRKSLYHLFSRHGTVVDVIALRAEGLRGQAWVIFEEVTCASSALREEQGYVFYGKPIQLQYAHQLSDVIARRDGVPKARRSDSNKKKGSSQQPSLVQPKTPNKEYDNDSDHSVSSSSDEDGPQQLNKKQKREPPSNILFASDLPSECNDMMIAMLFRQYAGFKECRMPRPGIAFIEFEDEAQATLAMRNLDGFKLTEDDTLLLTYGKI